MPGDQSPPSTDQPDQSYYDDLAAKIYNTPADSPELNQQIGEFVGNYLAQHNTDPNPDVNQFQSDLENLLGSVNAAAIAEYIAAYVAGLIQYTPPSPNQSTPVAAEPVNLATGQFEYSVTDFVVPGAGLDLAFTRTYKSGAFYLGPLGASWDHSCNLWLVDNGDTSVTVTTGQLYPIRCFLNQVVNSPYYVAVGSDDTIVATTDDAFEQQSPDGRVVRFENISGDGTTYQAVQISDRFGNTLSLEYDDQYLLNTVTVNNPQRVVTFTYDSLSRIINITLFPATYTNGPVTALIERVWTYEYDDFGDLVTVTAPPTDEFPQGRATQYAYSSPSSSAVRAHDLLNITDPNGATYLETEYGAAKGTVAFGRVVSQCIGSGVFLFEYEDVLQDPSWTYADQDCPTSCVTVVQRNGHSVYYVLNALGNILFSQETILADSGEAQIMWRYAYDADSRRIASLSPQGRVTQVYYGREYFYERPINPGDPTLSPWMDPNLSAQEHARFANVLATVRRFGLFDFSTLSEDLSIYGDIFPDALTPDALGSDIITKYTYEDVFQQRATVSDPRYTTNAGPASPESLNPSSPYSTHLTVATFNGDAAVTPKAITYPDTTYPATLPNGANGVIAAQVSFDAYDQRGRLLQYTLPEGNSVGFSYFHGGPAQPTIDGFLASRTLGVGVLDLMTRFGVNEAGQVVSITDPRGYTTSFGIDADSLVRTITPPVTGYAITSTYDGNRLVTSRLTAIINPDGSTASGSPETATFAYNSEMSPTLIAFGDSSGTPLRQSRRVYDSSNCLIRLVLPRGNSICYGYEERLLLKQETRACCACEAATTAYGYDLDGLRVSVTDPRGGVTASTLDPFGRTIGITDPLGNLRRIDYDKLDNAVVRRWFGAASNGTYPLLRLTEYTYDERNQLVRERKALFSAPIDVADPWAAPDAEFNAAVAAGMVQFCDTLTYRDGNLRVFRLVDADGNATTKDYDTADRSYRTTDPTGSYDITTYDSAGNVQRLDRYCLDATAVVRAVISTLYEYDSLNRVTASTDGAGNRVTRGLDSRDLLLNQTDALGHTLKWTYNGFRDRITETHVLLQSGAAAPVQLTADWSYDPNSNVVGVTDPDGNTTAMQYDLLDRLTRVTNPDGTSRNTRYDQSSNPIQRTDEDGVVVNQTFDADNRLTTMAVQQSAAPPASAEQMATFAYDGVGALIAHENTFVRAVRNFDSVGRCYQEAFTFGPPLNAVQSPLTISRQFDRVSNLIQLSYPSGQTVGYGYDSDNRLVQIYSSANANAYPGDATAPTSRPIIQKTQWGDLQVSAQLGNGIVIASAHDPAGRSIADGCVLGNGDGFQLQQLWDGAGNRRLIIENYAHSTQGSLFEYDSTNRLTDSPALNHPVLIATNVLAPPTSPLPASSLSAQGKIDTIIGGFSVTLSPQPEFSYDAAGNRTRASSVSYTSNARNEYISAGSTQFSYNGAGRLIGDATFVYVYNLRGQLVQAASQSDGSIALQVFHDALGRPAGVVESGRTRVLVTDSGGVIESWDNGVLSAVYLLEGRDQLCFFAAGGKDQYVFRDVLESTRLTSDSQAAAIGVFRYDPFGVLLSGAPATPFLYSGKYQYASIAWYEYRRRQYIPNLGRFAQPDPAGFVDGPNLYTFVGNNPLSARDPNGTGRTNVPAAASDGSTGDSTSSTDESMQEVHVYGVRPIRAQSWSDWLHSQSTAVPFYFPPAEGDLITPTAAHDTGSTALNLLTNSYLGVGNLIVSAVNALGNLTALGERGAKAVGFSDIEIQAAKDLLPLNIGGEASALISAAAGDLAAVERAKQLGAVPGKGTTLAAVQRATQLGVFPGKGTTPYFNAAWGRLSPTYLRGRTYAQAVNQYVSGLDTSATTITQTPGGVFGTSQGLSEGAFWQPLSADYAVEAGLLGRADVVLGDVASQTSVWATIERPILEFFGVQVRVHLRVIP